MELNVKKNGNVVVVYLRGRMDVHLTKEIEKEISILIADEASSHLILNLKEVEYISSSGIGLFVSVMNSLKKRGNSLVLCNINSAVKRILDLVQLTSLFRIEKTEEESVKFLESL